MSAGWWWGWAEERAGPGRSAFACLPRSPLLPPAAVGVPGGGGRWARGAGVRAESWGSGAAMAGAGAGGWGGPSPGERRPASVPFPSPARAGRR